METREIHELLPSTSPQQQEHSIVAQTAVQIETETVVEKSEKLPVKLLHFVQTHWFLIGLFIVILIAALDPRIGEQGGTIRSEITVSYVGVALIFVISGLSLPSRALLDSLLYWRLILLVQSFCLLIIPFSSLLILEIVYLIVPATRTSFNPDLITGILVAMCIPTTISSNVLMTKSAGGNEAGALINAVLGSVLGVFITPLIIFWILGIANLASTVSGGSSASSAINYGSVFANLAITVIGPLLVGQLIQYLFPSFVKQLRKTVNLAIINSCLLLLLVYQVFCDTFASNSFSSLSAGAILATVCLVGVIFAICSLSLFSFSTSSVGRKSLGYTSGDTIAIVMCGATKSAALGIPLIKVLFKGNPSGVGVICLPLLMYHAEQLIGGSFLVAWFKTWMKKRKELVLEGEDRNNSGNSGDTNVVPSNNLHVEGHPVILEVRQPANPSGGTYEEGRDSYNAATGIAADSKTNLVQASDSY